MTWYMVRCMKTNVYTGPFDEERAKREALELVAQSKGKAEILPIGNPSFVAEWSGATVRDVRR